jgi:hypothetical protein
MAPATCGLAVRRLATASDAGHPWDCRRIEYTRNRHDPPVLYFFAPHHGSGSGVEARSRDQLSLPRPRREIVSRRALAGTEGISWWRMVRDLLPTPDAALLTDGAVGRGRVRFL